MTHNTKLRWERKQTPTAIYLTEADRLRGRARKAMIERTKRNPNIVFVVQSMVFLLIASISIDIDIDIVIMMMSIVEARGRR